MLIVLVEDDHLQADWMIPHVTEKLPDAEIVHIKTESAFRSYIASPPERTPAVFIIDEMLRWADRARLNKDGDVVDVPSAPPADAMDPQRAGKRIIELILADQRLSHVPIVLYTVLEPLDLRYLDLPAHVKTVSKNTPPEELISAVSAAAGRARSSR